MKAPPDLVVINPDGSVRVAGKGAEMRLRDRAGSYRLIVDTPGLVVMRAAAPEGMAEAQGPRVLMAGEIVSGTTMLEIINVVANANWRGELRVFAADTQRTLFFDQGAVKHANSDHPDDRLGEVLYRLGVVSRAQLEALLREVTPERRFGHLLVEKQIVQRDQLFTYLQKQVEQIFHAVLLVRHGAYVFGTPDEGAEPPATTVHMAAQGLLMEGVQRLDEMALFRERIPHGGLCPEVVPGSGRASMTGAESKGDQTASLVMAYCDGSRSIVDIARETGLGEFETTKTLYHLLQQGQVVLHASPKADDDELRRMVAQFNDVLRDIFVAVATYGKVEQTRQTLSSWIQGSGYAPYFGDEVEDDGSVSADRVAKAIGQTKADRPMEALHQALHELAAFALFAATTSLPRDQELVLTRDVNRRLKAVRM